MRHTNTHIAITRSRYRSRNDSLLLRVWLTFWGFLRGPTQ